MTPPESLLLPCSINTLPSKFPMTAAWWEITITADMSTGEHYGLCRRIWQSQVRELRQDQQLWAAAVAADRATAEAVHTLLSILEGSEQSLKAATRTWLELMAAQALHKFPGALPLGTAWWSHHGCPA